MKLKINNSKDVALWESIKCTCNKGIVMEEHPVKSCEFCRCEIAWNSVPKKSFLVTDKKGNPVTINEINLIRGRHEDIMAWSWSIS